MSGEFSHFICPGGIFGENPNWPGLLFCWATSDSTIFSSRSRRSSRDESLPDRRAGRGATGWPGCARSELAIIGATGTGAAMVTVATGATPGDGAVKTAIDGRVEMATEG